MQAPSRWKRSPSTGSRDFWRPLSDRAQCRDCGPGMGCGPALIGRWPWRVPGRAWRTAAIADPRRLGSRSGPDSARRPSGLSQRRGADLLPICRTLQGTWKMGYRSTLFPVNRNFHLVPTPWPQLTLASAGMACVLPMPVQHFSLSASDLR